MRRNYIPKWKIRNRHLSDFQRKYPHYLHDWIEFVDKFCRKCQNAKFIAKEFTISKNVFYPKSCCGWTRPGKYMSLKPILQMLVKMRINCIHFKPLGLDEKPICPIETNTGFELIL